MGTRERDAAGDVVGARAAHDHGRMTVDHAVVNGSRLIVIRIAGADDVGIQISEVATRDLEQGCGGGHEMLPGVGGQRAERPEEQRTPPPALCHDPV